MISAPANIKDDGCCRWAVLGLIGLMLWVAGVAWWITRHGPGFEGNSVPYVSAARTFAQSGVMMVPDDDGTGKMVPLSLWPPFYPGAMALLSKFFGDVLVAGRWLNIILFPLNVFLLAALGRKLGLARGPLALVCVLFAFAPGVLYAHTNLMSESICLFWWLAALNVLLIYQQRPSWPVLGGAALAAGLTWTSRYIGLALIASGGFYILVVTAGAWPKRMTRAVVFGLWAIAPLEIWNHFLSQASVLGPRQWGFNGLAAHQINHTVAAWVRWLAPFDELVPVKIVVLIVFVGWVALVIAGLRKQGRALFAPGADGVALNRDGLLLVLLNLAAVEGIIFLTALFLDVTLDMGERMHFFAYVFSLLLMAAMGTAWWRRARADARPPARLYFTAVPAIILAAYLAAGSWWIGRAYDLHLNYNSRAWQESPSLALLKQRYGNALIYTNHPSLLYLQMGRTDIRGIPFGYERTRPIPLPDFPENFTTMLRETASRHGIIVYFREEFYRRPLADVIHDPRLKVVADLPDAIFFEPTNLGQ
jgi:hypothetical protein